MPVTATITELWRHPVKSFQGERVDELVLAPGGVPGDRALGVVDTGSGRVLSAKTVPALLLATARTEPHGVVVTLPDGREHGASDPGVHEALSSWLDRPVRLVGADEAPGAAYEMTFDPPDDDAELVAIPTPPGGFRDLADVHLLSHDALGSLAAAEPAHQWDVRRFRPTVLVTAADSGTGSGFPEHAWVGRQLDVGDATIRVDQRTVRCAVPLRAQPGLARDVGVYRALVDRVDNHLGVYATVAVEGTVRVGDAIRER